MLENLINFNLWVWNIIFAEIGTILLFGSIFSLVSAILVFASFIKNLIKSHE